MRESEYFGEQQKMCQIDSCRKFIPSSYHIHLCRDCRKQLNFELLAMQADVRRDIVVKHYIDHKYMNFDIMKTPV